MSSRRRPSTDLDAEIAALEREVAAATGTAAPAEGKPDREARLDRAKKTGSSLLRKVVAAVILIAAVAILLRIAVGVIAGIVWIAVAIVAVFATFWAVRQFKRGTT